MKVKFKQLEDIGVVWVVDEATKLGYYNGNPEWANLGQGEPEVGQLPEGAPRINNIHIEQEDNRYGPLNGLYALRQTIATHYNRLYRFHKKSKYTARNVSIAMGGRLMLSRIFAIMGKVKLGYKIPEYPAYQDLINYQSPRVKAICIPTSRENNYILTSAEFKLALQKTKLDFFLMSNPCNPTGHVIQSKELQNYLRIASKAKCALIIDEVYSHYIYDNAEPANFPVSSASFLEDVNKDEVIIVDALTKSFRYPGWRLAWALSTPEIIENIGKAASGIDGGASLPIQRAAIQLFDAESVDAESKALRKVFSHKQNTMVKALRQMGILCNADASSTFYVWADISQLPDPLNDAEVFFKEALKHKVICVPGYLFNINPEDARHHQIFAHHVRFSFGPDETNLKLGLLRLFEMIHPTTTI